jgi:signal transduction histidine kinase
VRATLDGVRRLAADLRPRLLDDLGLAAAVRSLVGEWAERTGIPVALTAALPPGAHVPPATAIAVYRMTQEALANVERHARATRVEVTLAVGGGALVAEVRDDGRGLPAAARRPTSPDGAAAASGPIPRLGLFAAGERIGLVRGRFAVESAPGSGTTVRAVVPLPRDSPRLAGADQRDRSATDSGALGADPAEPDRPAARGA